MKITPSLHEPFTNAWKTQTAQIIDESDVVIVLIGRGTHGADGVIWEIRKAIELGKPIFGVHISKKRMHRGAVPKLLRGRTVIEWTHEGISEQLDLAFSGDVSD